MAQQTRTCGDWLPVTFRGTLEVSDAPLARLYAIGGDSRRFLMIARLLCLLLAARVLSAGEVTRADRWELHSSFWMNLHQTLMHDASARNARDLTALPPEERTT